MRQKPKLTHSKKLNVNISKKIISNYYFIDDMRMENFQLKKELVKLKLRFALITIEEACKELGCCASEFLDEIGVGMQ